MRQGNHAPGGFCDKQLIFLIKIKERERNKIYTVGLSLVLKI